MGCKIEKPTQANVPIVALNVFYEPCAPLVPWYLVEGHAECWLELDEKCAEWYTYIHTYICT